MRKRAAGTLFALLIVGSSPVGAQDAYDGQGAALVPVPPPSRSRLSADSLLSGRPLPSSFADLSMIFEPGHEVVVVDDAGRVARGRVSSITRDGLVLYQGIPPGILFRLFRSPEERTFPAGTVSRIDVVDSTWNGALIGAAVAPLVVYGIHRWEEAAVPDTNNMKGLGTIVFGGISAVLAVQIGRWIDLSMNEAVYEGGGESAITLSPLLGPTATGVSAKLRF